MEKLLQNIVKKFIKQIDFSKIKLKNVQNGHADEIDPSTEEGNDYHVYQIKYGVLTVGTVVTVTNRIEGTKYLSNIDIIAPFRSRGIGGYVLKHWFSGYYIMADNTRAGKLYARLGKVYNKFTHREFEEFIKLAGLRGVYKLDSRRAITMRDSKPYKDDSKELIGTIGALIIVGLGMAIKKAVTSIVKRKAASNKENEILRAIRSGEINEQYFTKEMKAQIVMSIDRLFNQGALDAFFESNRIDPTKQKAYVNKIKNGVKKCQTLQQIIDFLNSDSSFVLPTYFDGLETMNRLFQKAKMMKDSKIKDDNTDFALKIIDKTQSIVKKLNYPVVTSYLAKIKNAIIGGNESALNSAVGNVIDFFASKEFDAQYKDKDLKKAKLLKVARETINELYGLPIRDSKPCNILTHDSMPWTKDVILSKRLKKKLKDDYPSDGTKNFQKASNLVYVVMKGLPKFGAKMYDEIGDAFLGSKGERALDIAEKALYRILDKLAYVKTDPGSIPLNAPRIKNDIKESLKGLTDFESAESRTPETTKFRMILQTALNLI